MELLKGRTLAQKIAAESRLELGETLEIMIQVVNALVKIHSKGIVHRDLKPENIMLVEKDGNPNFVKLLDFGLARGQNQTRITETGTVLGTLNYMSPEQISSGSFSPASDIYALGGIFYETVTGQIPFPGENVTAIMRQVMDKVPSQPILLRPDLPLEFNNLTMEMLEKDSEKRPTVQDVLASLKKINAQLLCSPD